ncbi:hypothetical protein, partial [Nonomuraea thailandensis]|uniref:hypothetical protein n=1 Tax=Nonomuraea thailandensis TaxID=1188745 RepID=UPI0031F0C63C
HENHALAFDTLLSSQETDAYFRLEFSFLNPSAEAPSRSSQPYQIVVFRVKSCDLTGSGSIFQSCAPRLRGNPRNLPWHPARVESTDFPVI